MRNGEFVLIDWRIDWLIVLISSRIQVGSFFMEQKPLQNQEIVHQIKFKTVSSNEI